MKTILWYQPEKFGVPDVICQDGEIISGFQREEAIERNWMRSVTGLENILHHLESAGRM